MHHKHLNHNFPIAHPKTRLPHLCFLNQIEFLQKENSILKYSKADACSYKVDYWHRGMALKLWDCAHRDGGADIVNLNI